MVHIAINHTALGTVVRCAAAVCWARCVGAKSRRNVRRCFTCRWRVKILSVSHAKYTRYSSSYQYNRRRKCDYRQYIEQTKRFCPTN
jgi:hypothetical protein